LNHCHVFCGKPHPRGKKTVRDKGPGENIGRTLRINTGSSPKKGEKKEELVTVFRNLNWKYKGTSGYKVFDEIGYGGDKGKTWGRMLAAAIYIK